MSTAKPGLRERLATTDEFVTVTELVPWRGATADRAGRADLAAAHALVDDHVLSARQELLREERRARHRVAASVVRDRERRDSRVVDEGMRGCQARPARPVGRGPAPRDQLGDGDELVGRRESLAEAQLRRAHAGIPAASGSKRQPSTNSSKKSGSASSSTCSIPSTRALRRARAARERSSAFAPRTDALP